MIRNESEYQEAVRRLQDESERLSKHRERLSEMKLGKKEIKRALDPLISFHEQLVEEVDSYERLKRGDIKEIENLHGLGFTLIALRIARGLTQRELADKLGVHETQVSRDERNEYHGITVERASRIMDVLGVNLRSKIDQPIQKPKEFSTTITEICERDPRGAPQSPVRQLKEAPYVYCCP